MVDMTFPNRGPQIQGIYLTVRQLFLLNLVIFKTSSKSKTSRTVTFTKSGENAEKVHIRPGTEHPSQFHSPNKPCSTGRRYQNHSGGCDRQQDVKLELQMNKVSLDLEFS